MTGTPLRLALLGHGWAGGVHVRAARAAGLQIVSVTGRDYERAASFASQHDIANVGTDWVKSVRADDVDAVIVATPNVWHAQQGLAALQAGKHVLVEKPMATNSVDASAMLAAAEQARRVLLVGHMWRYRQEVIALRDRIRTGELGRVVRTRGYGVHAGWGPSGWFTNLELAGGGALIDMGVHAVDTVRFLLGDPLPRRVVASIGTAYGQYEVDDDGVLMIDWTNGVRSIIEFGWWQPQLGGLEADTEVLGTAGYARIWNPVQPEGYDHGSLTMYTEQMRDFANCAATGQTPAASGHVGQVALDVVLAAYQSAAELTPPSPRRSEPDRHTR